MAEKDGKCSVCMAFITPECLGGSITMAEAFGS